MKTWLTIVAVLVACGAARAVDTHSESSSRADCLMKGKVMTDRTIRLATTVDARPSEVFRLWTTVEGTKKFLAPAAKIHAKVGGRYEIIFEPNRDPEGADHGTQGARILKIVPNREVAFEWPMPPFGPELGAIPNPTWVELRFEPVEGNRRRIHLAHCGFRHGHNWDKAFEVFRDRNWPLVLGRLQRYCYERKSPQSSSGQGL